MDFSRFRLDDRALLLERITEFRSRLIRVAIFLGVLFVICYIMSETFLELLRAPLKDQVLVFLKPTEPFFVHIKLAFFAAITFSLPYLAYHIWAFIAPSLKEDERHPVLLFIIFAIVFFVLGVIFCYYLIIPYGIGFLLIYKTSSLTPRLSVDYYMTLSVIFMFIFGFVFELPLIIVFLTKLGIVQPAMLSKYRKYAILIIFIVSAILTPPDCITQIMMAVPLTILYEVGIVLSKMVYRKKRQQEVDAALAMDGVKDSGRA